MIKRFFSIFTAAAAIMLTLCACTSEPVKSEELSIVCTAFPQYDFAKNILGTDKGLTLLLDGKEDFHSYEPNAADIIAIGSADLLVYIGNDSEKWIEKTVAASSNPSLRTFAITDAVTVLEEETVEGMQTEHDEHEESENDEHVWLSLKNARLITEKLCEEICAVDPQNAEKYKSNAEEYITQLEELDKEYAFTVSQAARKTLIFADRFPFRYLVEDYGLEYYAAFPGCSAETEASFETMATLIDKTVASGVPYVFIIDGSDGSIAEAVSKSTGAGILVLDSCQSVSTDDIADGKSYLGAMKNNLEALGEVLG